MISASSSSVAAVAATAAHATQIAPRHAAGTDLRFAEPFEGEIFRQACLDALSNTYYVGPEDLPDPDRPPN